MSKETYRKVDYAVFLALWRWAKRRHPTKSRRWVKNKYFPPTRDQQWVFQGEVAEPEEAPYRVRLFQASNMSIRRHVKIQGDANPYDPQWEPYFEQRIQAQMEATLRGKGMLLGLWREQNGICPVCQQRIDLDSGWQNHHIEWRVYGGQDHQANRVLLHPNCHRQVHNQRLSVVKSPRLLTGVEKA